MGDVSPGAFLSYSHEDDQLAGGNILDLARRLANEYSLITGHDLNLFVDQSAIEWGDEWRGRINGALAETTFFIPIVTPRYFTRPECRKEAIAFHDGAQSLGAGELLLPILYSPVPNFTESNPDELIALISRYQYADWTDNRLLDPQSSQYRRVLHGLAQRLAESARTAAERQTCPRAQHS